MRIARFTPAACGPAAYGLVEGEGDELVSSRWRARRTTACGGRGSRCRCVTWCFSRRSSRARCSPSGATTPSTPTAGLTPWTGSQAREEHKIGRELAVGEVNAKEHDVAAERGGQHNGVWQNGAESAQLAGKSYTANPRRTSALRFGQECAATAGGPVSRPYPDSGSVTTGFDLRRERDQRCLGVDPSFVTQPPGRIIVRARG